MPAAAAPSPPTPLRKGEGRARLGGRDQLQSAAPCPQRALFAPLPCGEGLGVRDGHEPSRSLMTDTAAQAGGRSRCRPRGGAVMPALGCPSPPSPLRKGEGRAWLGGRGQLQSAAPRPQRALFAPLPCGEGLGVRDGREPRRGLMTATAAQAGGRSRCRRHRGAVMPAAAAPSPPSPLRKGEGRIAPLARRSPRSPNRLSSPDSLAPLPCGEGLGVRDGREPRRSLMTATAAQAGGRSRYRRHGGAVMPAAAAPSPPTPLRKGEGREMRLLHGQSHHDYRTDSARQGQPSPLSLAERGWG